MKSVFIFIATYPGSTNFSTAETENKKLDEIILFFLSLFSPRLLAGASIVTKGVHTSASWKLASFPWNNSVEL